jgi:hypothetical protein
MNEYNFESNNGKCLEHCKVLNDDTKIGSVACQSCKFNNGNEATDKYSSPKWIKCSKIEEATGN